MQNIINKILESSFGLRCLELASSLDETQILILIIITLLLTALLIYRWMGAGVFFVFLFVVMIVYLVYRANIFTFYEKQNKDFNNRMKAVQIEIDSSKPRTGNNNPASNTSNEETKTK